MQQILIDIARRKQRLKHGANQVGDQLDESRIAMSVPSEELLAVNDALAALALEDPQAAEVVQMRYFVGMTVPEIAVALDLAPRTVDRHWALCPGLVETRHPGVPFRPDQSGLKVFPDAVACFARRSRLLRMTGQLGSD